MGTNKIKPKHIYLFTLERIKALLTEGHDPTISSKVMTAGGNVN